MSVSQISRFHDRSSRALVFTDSTTTTEGFVMAQHGGVLFMVDAVTGGPTVTLTFHAKQDRDSATAYSLANTGNTPITMTVQAGRCYQLPDQLFAASFVMATTGSAGQTVNCFVQLKG